LFLSSFLLTMAKREPPIQEPNKDEPLDNVQDTDMEALAARLDTSLANIPAAGRPQPPQPAAQYNFNFNVDATTSEDDDDDDDGEDDDENRPEPILLPPALKHRVEYLKTLNEERKIIMNDYLKERAALEQRYQDLCRPLYEKRKRVVVGDMDVEIASASPNDLAEAEAEEQQVPPKGIPQFWVTAMGHMEGVSELITEQDVECLESLTDITCSDHPNGNGFALTFHFDTEKNSFFTNPVLIKEYDIPNLLLEDEPVLKDVRGCDIHWKPGKCLTHRQVKKTQRAKSGKRQGQVRTVVKKEKRDSFFHFFNPPKMPSADNMDEETADALEEAFDHDFDVAQAFRSHIIPQAVLWFTGEAMFDEESDDEDDAEEEEHGDGDSADELGNQDTSAEIDKDDDDDAQNQVKSMDGVYA